jgi:hypothetical protein
MGVCLPHKAALTGYAELRQQRRRGRRLTGSAGSIQIQRQFEQRFGAVLGVVQMGCTETIRIQRRPAGRPNSIVQQARYFGAPGLETVFESVARPNLINDPAPFSAFFSLLVLSK